MRGKAVDQSKRDNFSFYFIKYFIYSFFNVPIRSVPRSNYSQRLHLYLSKTHRKIFALHNLIDINYKQ